jgi:hypothetical protein
MASTTDLPRNASALGASPGARADAAPETPRWWGGARFYGWLALVCLVVAAVSLLIPSTPSYDPWSWLVWSREIVHGQLIITTGGTSWKPLPMIFTIPFALFGGAAPFLWLIVARAGALAAVVMVFRLAFRLTRRVGGLFGSPDAGLGRFATLAPALLAGCIGAVSLALSASGGFVSSNTLGYSEGLATALLLVAIECVLDGRLRAAFFVGFLVALDRPEIWLFWAPLGLWLLWRDPGMRAWVVGSAALVLVAWFLPVKLGCGSFTCSVARAVHPRSNSLAFAHDPFVAELKQAAWPTMLLRIKLVAALLVAATVVLLARARSRGEAVWSPAHRARAIAALLGLGGLAWFVVIAIMTQVGFSGNNRYLVLGSALVDTCGAIAYGWAATELWALVHRRRGRVATAGAGPAEGGAGTGGARTGGAVTGGAARGGAARGGAGGIRWACAGLLALVFAFGPNWIGQNLISIPRTHGSLVYQAHLRQGMAALVARAGGARRLLACGSVMTEGFQVPLVAWTLGVPTTRVEGPPADGGAKYAEPAEDAPNVILQTRDTRSASLLPLLSTWPSVAYHYAGTAGPVHMFTHCAAG